MPSFRFRMFALTHVAVLAPAALLVGGLPLAHVKSAAEAARPPRESSSIRAIHEVAAGETLWNISRRYGCMPVDVKRANRLTSNLIIPGRKLRVPRCANQARRRSARRREASRKVKGMLFHRVDAGESLWTISRRYDTTVEDIQLRNGMAGNVIRPGMELDILPGSGKTGRAIVGQSVGRTHAGRLVAPTRLGKGGGYYIRRPTRVYGANHTVHGVKRVIAIVRQRHPQAHVVAVGDISAKRGGKLSQHRSHQTGRDVDIGFYFKKKPKRYPRQFVKATIRTLDFDATWTLISSFVGMASSDNGVERIFLDYGVQKQLYNWAKAHGVEKITLRKMFQYPSGRRAAAGVIRHEPGHADHIHVRFKCPKRDNACI